MSIWKTLLLSLLTTILAQGAPKEPTVVFVLAEKEYLTAETVPAYYEKHLKPLGIRGKFVTAPPDGDDRYNLKGLETALEGADLVFLSVRRRAPKIGQMEALKKFVTDGKPVVGIRTSSHPFHLRKAESPAGHAQWQEFDPAILGGNYNGHYGNKQKTTWRVSKEAEGHAILKGVPANVVPSGGSLYRSSPLKKTTTTLATARAEGVDDVQPVAWTNRPESGSRVFYTSLGHVSDFENEAFTKLLTNGVFWALAMETPCK